MVSLGTNDVKANNMFSNKFMAQRNLFCCEQTTRRNDSFHVL